MNTMKLQLLMLFLIVAPAFAADTVNQRMDASNDDSVRIENIAGSITVEGWSRNEVQVIGTIADDVEEFIFERRGDSIDIIVEWPRGGRHSRHDIDDSDLDIKVPMGVDVEISAVSADIEVSGVNGEIDAQSVSGDVSVQGESAEIRMNTVSGDIQLTGSADNARVSVETVSGELLLDNLHGELKSNSISGDISLRSSRIFRMVGETISGDMSLEMDFEEEGIYQFEAINGDIELIGSKEPDASFDLSSFNGDIDNEYGPKPERTSKYAPGVELRFKSGNGSAEVSANTLNGDIVLEIR